ncbi:hypothetical protein D3C80_1111090 [compost metagenome]
MIPVPKVNEKTGSTGKSRVVICTAPPEKSPGRSGEAVLLITILSIRLDGIISKEKARLSVSVLGNAALFIKETLYLSLRPLTTTNLLS